MSDLANAIVQQEWQAVFDRCPRAKELRSEQERLTSLLKIPKLKSSSVTNIQIRVLELQKQILAHVDQQFHLEEPGAGRNAARTIER